MSKHILSVDGVKTPRGEAMAALDNLREVAKELKASNRIASMAITLAVIHLEHSIRQI